MMITEVEAADTVNSGEAARGGMGSTPVKSWHSALPVRSGPLPARARQTLYRAGELLTDLPMIQSGWAIRLKRLPDGRRQILCFVLPGEIGAACALFTDRLAVSIEAVTPLRYAVYDRAAAAEKVRKDPELMREAISACLAEQNEVEELAVDLGRRRAEGRIARLFLNLRERLARRGMAKGGVFDMPLRQQHIADATGMTVIHVGRILGTMRDDGIIRIDSGKLEIVNRSALQTLADA